MKKVVKSIISKLVFNILKNYMSYIGLLFLRGRMNIEKFKKLVSNLHDKMKSYSNKKFKARIKS